MSATFPSGIPAHLRIDTSCPSPGTVRVVADGEIDLSTVDILLDGLLGVLSANRPSRIEVDLAGITFLDCGGLTVLLTVSKAAAQIGCQLRIASPQPIVRRILDLTGLLDVLAAPFDQIPNGATASGSAAPVGSTLVHATFSAAALAAV